jgi:DNA-binding beta-propeller fold protein YncE
MICMLRMTALLALFAAQDALVQPAYVVNGTTNSVSVIDAATNALVGSPIQLSTGYFSGAVAAGASPDGSKVYVLFYGHPGAMQVIDTATRSVIATILGWHDPTLIAVSPDNSKVYVAAEGGIDVLNTATNASIGSIALNNIIGISGIAISQDGSKLFIVGQDTAGGEVWVAATATNSVIATIPAGASAGSPALSPDGSKLYVGIFKGTAQLVVISTTTNTVVASIPVGVDALSVAPDGARSMSQTLATTLCR